MTCNNEIPKIQELMELGKYNKGNVQEKDEIKPIFIVGVPRCGSTLIEKVIASGSKKISVGEETAIISFYVGKKVTSNQSISSNIKALKKEIVERYKSRGLIKKENEYIFTDKSLDNFFFIGLIKEIFPNAKIINCKRNTSASMISILKNNLGDVTWAHEVKHIFKALDSRVIHLHRHSFAGFEIDAVSPGKYQVLKEKVIQKLVEGISV